MTNVLIKTALEAGLYSADSHVMEPIELWDGLLPREFWANLSTNVLGGTDPEKRTAEMAQDGVIAEVLYPTLGLRLFGIEDPALQEATFRRYNEWLADYCKVAPGRLIGVGLVSAYDAQKAVEEINWCAKAGFKGILLWQVPHPDLPLRSHHYDPIWEAASRLGLPVSLHILSGFPYQINKIAKSTVHPSETDPPAIKGEFNQLDRLHRTVNLKLFAAIDSTLELVLSGVFERYPNLKIVVVENEIGWLPFATTQWDYFCQKQGTSGGAEQDASPLRMMPSEYVARNVYATFFRDVLSANIFESWGSDNFMWSNDFPHHNSTWPHSGKFISEQLATLSEEMLTKVLRTNAERLYGPAPSI